LNVGLEIYSYLTNFIQLDDLNFPRRTKRELLWFSTFIFTLTALFVRFAINLQTAVVMKFLHIKYEYQPFGNLLEKAGRGNWTDSKVILVFSIGPLVAFLLGLVILMILKNNKLLTWKTRLVLTWIAFVFIHLLPFGMLAGVVFYDDFGYAFTNIFMSPMVRLAISLIFIVVAVYFRPFWLKLFLKASMSHRIASQRSTYLKFVFIRPWMLATLILAVFAAIGQYWSWLTVIVLMGIVVLPFFNWADPKMKLKLSKTGTRFIFKNTFSIVLYVFIIVALLAASVVKMHLL